MQKNEYNSSNKLELLSFNNGEMTNVKSNHNEDVGPNKSLVIEQLNGLSNAYNDLSSYDTPKIQ